MYNPSGGLIQLGIRQARRLTHLIFIEAIPVQGRAIGRPADTCRKQQQRQAENEKPLRYPTKNFHSDT
jgi:hypothetical protein